MDKPERCRDIWEQQHQPQVKGKAGGTTGWAQAWGSSHFLPSFILILNTNMPLLPGFYTKYDFCWANYIRMDATGIH